MTRYSASSVGAATSLTVLLVATPAIAASVRTFVKSTGVDSGACTLAAPCRGFAYAVTQTAPSGELDVLDTAGYGTVTITQGISIVAPAGVAASVAVPVNQDGITITAGASDKIVLRGLTIEGGGAGRNGIVFNSGGKLTVSDCIVQNFSLNGGSGPSTGNGIYISPTSGSMSTVLVTNTKLSNNAFIGLEAFIPTGVLAAITLVADRVQVDGNQYGMGINSLSQNGSIQASITNSIATGNTQAGYFLSGTNASIDNSIAAANNTGISVNSANVFLGRMVVTDNNTGLSGNARSYGDNRFNNNATDGTTSLTSIALH